MTDGMVITDPKGEILFFNDVARRYRIDLYNPLTRGLSLFDVIAPSRREIVQIILNTVNSTKMAQVTEAEYKHFNGLSKYFEIIFNPVLNDNRELEKICIVSRDITPQKNFEIKTTEVLRDFKNLIENANAVIFGVDTGGYVTEWNTESMRVTEYEKNDVYAQRLSKLFDPKKGAEVEALVHRTSNGENVSNWEIILLTKTGNPVTLLLNATPRLNASGKIVGTLFVGQDITELSTYKISLEQKVEDRTRKLVEAMTKERELVEVKNRFVSIASHEFRVPLASIRSAAHFLREQETLTMDGVGKLDVLERQVNYMNTLLEDVLAVGKNTKQLKANLKEVDLWNLLHLIMEEVSINAKGTHRIMTDIPPGPIPLLSDERLLRNIFINLLTNAIKFSPGKEEVIVTVALDAGRVRIQVRDFGIGILPEDMPKLFEPFTRGTNTENIQGTGLGLSIVKKAVETLGGELSVESEPAQGTMFTIQFNQNPIRND
jgi:PAS domain S-box-containing protein